MGPFYTDGAGFLKEKEMGREKKKQRGAGAGGAQVVWRDEHSSETHVG